MQNCKNHYIYTIIISWNIILIKIIRPRGDLNLRHWYQTTDVLASRLARLTDSNGIVINDASFI